MKRSVKSIYTAQKVNMGGIILDQALPISELQQLDPFLLIHHWDSPLPGEQSQNEVGVGPHPHRGFSPVTFVCKGAVHHRDSRGNNSIVGAGGIQWMNSGMGIVHSERPTAELAENGGDFEIIQLWVNTPAKYKMIEPEYFPLSEREIPPYSQDNGKILIHVVVGSLGSVKSKLKTHTELMICKIFAQEGGNTTINIPNDYNALIYQLDGELIINDSFTSRSKNLVQFKNNGNKINISAATDSRAILMAGKPIGEEVALSGPFVMNTHTEIMEAVRDYQMGKMGVLIEEF